MFTEREHTSCDQDLGAREFSDAHRLVRLHHAGEIQFVLPQCARERGTLDEYESRLVGEDGRELPPGEIGDVFFLPPGGQGSTYRYVGATARSTQDGWETLGDLGYVDEEGFLYLVDRRTDMIVTGGENVYPAEVEAVLDSHPGVGSSCVIGLPDSDCSLFVAVLVIR